VYWIDLGKTAGEPFFLRLVTTEGRTVSEGIARANEEATMIGQMMSAEGVLEIPAICRPSLITGKWASTQQQ